MACVAAAWVTNKVYALILGLNSVKRVEEVVVSLKFKLTKARPSTSNSHPVQSACKVSLLCPALLSPYCLLLLCPLLLPLLRTA
ncbi:hypothetical protein BKA62DRAFT_697505 [Auriculariales sp. MPI-PUGE-AT-0066]|nr:hypothetical protein BKA62DRAFT_697505 [Auriculariales sp. MPI-PUGE-AT-0066]